MSKYRRLKGGAGRVVNSKGFRYGTYAMDVYNFGSDYKTSRRNYYGKRASFATAVGYAAPSAGAAHLTRHMPVKASIPITIGADIAGRYAVTKARNRLAKRSYQNRPRPIRKWRR